MKAKSFIILTLCLLQSVAMNAQKALYIPNEWKNPYPSDSLLYSEVDTENKYTWSKSRSKESDNFIVYWDKYYGNTIPTNSPSIYKVDIDDLLEKAEGFYALNVGKLAFCDEATSKVSKYKTMILINHTTTWTCYGAGYDYTVPALWLNPATCKPVGQSVAHEVGHSFQYMCYSDLGGHAGFHDAIGNGSTFWEQTAQWQSVQAYPEYKWSQSWSVFKNTANYAMTHEWMRYQSYWWHYYLAEKYGIDFIGKIWRHQMSKASDANEVLMDMMGDDYGVNGLFKDYFDYAMKMATIDLDVARDEAEPYIGTYTYNYVLLGGTKYQVAYSSCPQSTGFNVIQLKVPEAGAEVSVDFTSLKKSAKIASDDPIQYYNGESKFVDYGTKVFYNCYSNSLYKDRGFRIGYVALLKDGTRQYLYTDSIYCTGITPTKDATANVSCTIPENTKQLYLVVVPSPASYFQHKWDEDISNDDQWPYTIECKNTNIADAPIIDENLPISDVTLTYDVYFPKSTTVYEGTSFTISSEAAGALGTAFQMQVGNINSKMVKWATAGPSDDQMMFYAVNTNGSINNANSTANGYGHWFTSAGARCAYASGYLFSEFIPSSLTFSVGQYPGKLTNGKDYTIRQAIKYKKGDNSAVATFIFNVHVQANKTGAELSSIKQAEVVTDVNAIASPAIENNNIYTLDGRLVKDASTIQHGIYIKNGKKYIK